MTDTRILTRSDVEALLGWRECIAAVEEAFRLHALGKSLPPGVLGVRAPNGGFHIKAAGLELGRHYFAAKMNGNFPGNPKRNGLPAIQGAVVLCDASDGRPLAVMDSMEVTLRRTAAATSVAARHLARSDARTVAVCGCGTQGRGQLRALALVLPLEKGYVFDADPSTAASFARELSAELGFEIRPMETVAAAALEADVCVTCTPSRTPLLFRSDVAPGTFVAGVGADSSEKSELGPDLLAAGTVVVDVLEQCAEIGDLHHALAAGVMRREGVHAELAELVGGAKRGRTSAEEITIFDSTGTALEDVAAAALVYERAVAAGAGLSVALSD
jgi:alanine dehydrogenase